ncbi:hypothetical protein B9G54_05550 [Alloscardovia macacae]|uniref:Phage shock protein PspC N-terminal domain-containing protein n=2 Tax=Alloscardovia macacae TaxID=1160091 RepID=A0A1Y2SX39_9BIFI|nr:hypothetical protein B9G54_05550 [Alloscardovia macacae]OTA28932.1 hypothetical protein B9T39_05555 [Alloscardovia macacae]
MDTMTEKTTPPPLYPAKAPLYRPYQGRVFAGVCRGVSQHLGIPVWLVRLVFVVLTLSLGLGLIAYLFLWITLPSYNTSYNAAYGMVSGGPAQAPLAQAPLAQPLDPSATGAPAAASPAEYVGDTIGRAFAPSVGTDAASSRASSTHSQATTSTGPYLWNIIGIICVGLIIIFLGFDWAVERHILSPVIAVEVAIAAVCALAVWLYFERVNKGSILMTGAALAAFIVGVFLLLMVMYGRRAGLPMFGVFVIGIFSAFIIAAPWLAHAHQKLAEETAQKEREEQRADMAAHLHDSVLQTLNLIRQNAQNAEAVAQLARTQERELRRWLYEGREAESVSLASSMKLVAGRVEDTYGVPIEVITVGDVQPSEATDALVSATQQALTNACTHGATPVSLYVESSGGAGGSGGSGGRVEAFVRDHGEGFDIASVPADRLGVRESIVGRVERAGGTVKIVSRAGWGTEVRMSMPLG